MTSSTEAFRAELPGARPGGGTRALPLTIIRPRGRWAQLDLRELWTHRDLLYFLAWRDVKVRYKQTALGAAWVVIQPVALMVVFSVVFGAIAGLPSDGKPYPLYTFVALLPWQLFATSLNQASMSLVSNASLVSKVYVPRLLLPLSTLVSGLVDFCVAFLVLLALMAWFGLVPPSAALAVPLLVGFAMLAAVGIGVWLAAVNVQYRDVRFTLGFLTQVWLFATPVAYASSLVPPGLRPWFDLNPMVGVVEGFRWALLGSPFPAASIATGLIVSVAFLALGFWYFRQVERKFADVI